MSNLKRNSAFFGRRYLSLIKYERLLVWKETIWVHNIFSFHWPLPYKYPICTKFIPDDTSTEPTSIPVSLSNGKKTEKKMEGLSCWGHSWWKETNTYVMWKDSGLHCYYHYMTIRWVPTYEWHVVRTEP